MEKCPKCKERSLIFDPRLKRASCLNIDCSYRESMTEAEYSKRYETEEKNVTHKLFLYQHGRVGNSIHIREKGRG